MSLIESILELTDKVEALIAEGRWSEASTLEVERRRLLGEYVAAEGREAPGLRELYDRSLQSITEVDRQKKALTRDGSRFIRNSRAVDAYLDNTGKAIAQRGA